MDELQILNLADAPEHTEQVSRWLWEEWARADGYTLEEIIFRTRHSMLRDTVPWARTKASASRAEARSGMLTATVPSARTRRFRFFTRRRASW